MRTFLSACLIALVVGACVPQARAQSPTPVATDGPVLVVAAAELQGPYRGTVMLARPFGEGHVGFILNRPTSETLAAVFPEHAASKAVKEPIYFGGPTAMEQILALHRGGAKSRHSLELMPGVWVEFQEIVIDAIIEAAPNEARYYVGYVVWRPGELEAEVKSGKMTLAPARAELLFLPDTRGLHERLAPKRGQQQTRLER